MRLSEIYLDLITQEFRVDNAGYRFKTHRRTDIGYQCLDKTGKTTAAVPAHFGLAAIAVVKAPGKIRLTALAVLKKDKSIGSNTFLTMAQSNDLFRCQGQIPIAIVYQYEVVPGSIHFYKIHQHNRLFDFN